MRNKLIALTLAAGLGSVMAVGVNAQGYNGPPPGYYGNNNNSNWAPWGGNNNGWGGNNNNWAPWGEIGRAHV